MVSNSFQAERICYLFLHSEWKVLPQFTLIFFLDLSAIPSVCLFCTFVSLFSLIIPSFFYVLTNFWYHSPGETSCLLNFLSLARNSIIHNCCWMVGLGSGLSVGNTLLFNICRIIIDTTLEYFIRIFHYWFILHKNFQLIK